MSENVYAAPRSLLSPIPVAVVEVVTPKIVCDAPFGAISVAVMSPIQVWTGDPNVMLTSTAVGGPLSPLALKVTLRGVPGVGPHAVASAIVPRPVPGNVADGALTSGGVVNESALATVPLSVAE